ncbi:MAG: hypothetical protein AAFX06_28385 [Planctomycetota bacterium]
MKSALFVSLIALFAVGLVGCSQPAENNLATDGASADELAQYEKDLAAVSGDDSYEESDDDE